MMIIEEKVKCDLMALEWYLNGLKIDWTSLSIVIKKGSWSLDKFGYLNADNVIVAYASKWFNLAGKMELGLSRVIYHEWCHLQGVDKCRNLNLEERVSCIMYESRAWWKEVGVLPFQAARHFQLCDDCKKRLKF